MTAEDLITDEMIVAGCLARYGEFWGELGRVSRDFAKDEMREILWSALAASALPRAVEALDAMITAYPKPSLVHVIAARAARNALDNIEGDIS